MRNYTPPAGTERQVAVILIVLALPMSVPVAQKLLGRGPGFLRSLGFVEGPPGTLLAWGLAAATAAGMIVFAVRNIPAVAATWRRPTRLKLLVLPVAVVAAIVEEAAFRRWLMDWAQGAGAGVPAQVALSAAVFGLAHGFFGLIKGSWAAAARASLATGIMGALLASVYAAGQRSLAPPIAAHCAITLALEPGLMLAAVTGQWRASPRPEAPAR